MNSTSYKGSGDGLVFDYDEKIEFPLIPLPIKEAVSPIINPYPA
jgi:hypothetical protein